MRKPIIFFILVGLLPCPPVSAEVLECGDVLGSNGVNASDALGVLRRAVGEAVEFDCAQCVTAVSTTTSTTTTTLGGAPGADCTDPPAVRAGSDLRNCDLAGADFGFDSLCGADLRGADISGVRLRSADFARFEDATATAANLSFGSYVGTRFDRLMGDGVDFGFGDVRRARFVGATLTNADFGKTTLDDTSFAGANLQGAEFDDVVGTGTDFTGTDMTGVEWADGSLIDVIWSSTTCPDGSDSDANSGTCCGHGVGLGDLTVCSP